MKKSNVISSTAIWIVTGLALFASPTGAFASDRVIEDTLVYKDPTVAKKDHWVRGVAVDYWNVNTTILTPYGNMDVHMQQPGISAFVGYSDISVLASYRRGTGTADMTVGAPTFVVPVALHNSINDSQIELDLRWLMHSLQTKFMTPYVLVGHVEETANSTWTASYALNGANYQVSNPTDTSKTKTNGLGIGAIFPINSKFGVRADARYGLAKVLDAQTGSDKYSTSLITVTGYYNIVQGLNAQLGGRYNRDGMSSQGSASNHVTGIYATVGYSFR